MMFFLINTPSQSKSIHSSDQISKELSIFLNDVLKYSLESKIFDSQTRAQKTLLNKDLAAYALESQLGVSSSRNSELFNQRDSEVNRHEVQAKLSQYSAKGFRSFLAYDYTTTNRDTDILGKSTLHAPRVSVGIESKIFQDLLSDRHGAIEQRINQEAKLLDQQLLLQRKIIVASALYQVAELLEYEDQIQTQQVLCGKITRQTKKLRQKSAQGSISKRDYLLSQKELNSCNANVQNLKKLQVELSSIFEVNYKVDWSNLKKLGVENIFNELKLLYISLKDLKNTAPTINDLETQILQSRIEVKQQEQKNLDAKKESNLSLELQVGASGIDQSSGPAHEDIPGFKHPYFLVGASIGMPVAQREVELAVVANRYQLEALEAELKLKQDEINSELQSLEVSLVEEFSVFEQYRQNVKLSEEIVSVAQKDFDNGRIDFFNLTEFQKALTFSQQQQARQRLQIIAKLIKLADRHNTFTSLLE